jgi:hypothetical protein
MPSLRTRKKILELLDVPAVRSCLNFRNLRLPVTNRCSPSSLRVAKLALCATVCCAFPARAQHPPALPIAYVPSPAAASILTVSLFPQPPAQFDAKISSSRYKFVRANDLAFPAKPTAPSSPDTITKMEAAFSCNDTPFIDQVRLPFAALWHGRVRLTAFESDVTTANFVLGLPGAGTLNSLSLTGSGHLATRTPPSDQLVGMHLTFSLSGAAAGSPDNSGLRGLQHLARGGRNFLQSILVR